MKKLRPVLTTVVEVAFVVVIVTLLIDLVNSRDETDSPTKRSGLVLYTDYGTGLQYIKGGLCGGLVPRVDKDGNHMRVSNRDNQ